jgi:hypothetical protein
MTAKNACGARTSVEPNPRSALATVYPADMIDDGIT